MLAASADSLAKRRRSADGEARVTLFGHQFYKYLFAEAGYTRPIKFVTYQNLNGTDSARSV